MRKLPQALARVARRAIATLGPLSLLLTAGTALALPGGGGIRVDGWLIPAEEVWGEYSYQRGARDIIHPKPAGEVDPVIFKAAVDQVLQRNILAREAGRRGVSLTDQERAALREKQISVWKGENNFKTALAMLGTTEPFVMRRAEMNQVSRKMAEIDIEAQGAASEADLLAFYQANLKHYLGKSAALRYLLLPSGWTRKQVSEIAGEAEVYRKDGRDYEALVRRFSIHASAATAGVVPEGSEGSWPHPELGRGLQPGRLSRELRDEAGIHVYARDMLLPLPLETVRNRVVADQREARIAADLRSVAEPIRATAKIEFLDGAAPQGVTAPAQHKK